MKLHHPSQHRGPTFDARRFFEEVVPAALAQRTEAARAVGAVVRFELSDGPGASKAYTVDLAAGRVTADRDGPADARVTLPARDLEGLLTGKLDVAAAQAEGRLTVDGDPSALAELALLLRP